MQAEKLSDDLASLRIERPAGPSRHPNGSSRRIWIWLAGALSVPIAIAAYLIGRPHLEAQLFKTEIVATEILSLSPATVATELTASGYVVPQRLSKVGSKAAGRIARVDVAEGQRVTEGDLLIVLDEADRRSALSAGAARMFAAQAGVERWKARLAEVERKLERERVLVAEGVTGRASMEDLAAEARVLAQSLKAALADRSALAADRRALESALEDLSIRAPIDGTILTKPPQVGEVVSPSSTLLEIADFKSSVVEAEVPESRLAQVRLEGACEIMLDAYPARRYRGVVREISPVVNRAKATVVVKIAFVGEALGVLPNMAARAFILESEEAADQIGQPPKTVVPSSALVERDGERCIFVIDGDRARMIRVKIGAPFGPGFELMEGPRAGTRVVEDPPPTLAEGHRIKERRHD